MTKLSLIKYDILLNKNAAIGFGKVKRTTVTMSKQYCFKNNYHLPMRGFIIDPFEDSSRARLDTPNENVSTDLSYERLSLRISCCSGAQYDSVPAMDFIRTDRSFTRITVLAEPKSHIRSIGRRTLPVIKIFSGFMSL